MVSVDSNNFAGERVAVIGNPMFNEVFSNP